LGIILKKCTSYNSEMAAATSPASVRINSKSATMPKPRSNKEKIDGWLFHKVLVEGEISLLFTLSLLDNGGISFLTMFVDSLLTSMLSKKGSDETWRKRWVVLDVSTLSIWKKPTPTSDHLCESVPTHEITEMSYGASVEDKKVWQILIELGFFVVMYYNRSSSSVSARTKECSSSTPARLWVRLLRFCFFYLVEESRIKCHTYMDSCFVSLMQRETIGLRVFEL